MLESLGKNFEYKKLTEEEQQKRGILGRLVGPCADFIKPTRNGRKYSEQLWENVFNNPFMQEKIKNRCCFGELGHPTDRTETDMEKIALCLAEQPKKSSDGKLYSVFDILNTPNGRILKALCDYGCNIGISSRGQGDITTDLDGEDVVDPDTYDCECFDAVLMPGVESARLKYVTESLDTNKRKGLKSALKESLNQASDEDREIMQETLKDLNIELNEEQEKELEQISEEKEEEVKEAEVVEEEKPEEDNSKEEKEPEESSEDSEEEEVELQELEEEPQEEAEAEVEEQPEEVEKEEKELSEEEKQDIVINWLSDNFDKEQIQKICDILKVEIVDDEASGEKEIEKPEDEKDSNEVEKTEENIENSDKEEAKEEQAEESEAVDEGLGTLVNSLQEALKIKSDLEVSVKVLQEKLAVSDAKVNEIKEECERYKKSITRLSKISKSNEDLKESVSKLEESLNEKDVIINEQKIKIARLVESKKENVRNSNSLNESVTAKDNEIKKLNENLIKMENSYKEELSKLSSDVAENQKQIKTLTESIAKTSALKESYKKLANKTVNKYIEIKADMLGLTSKDIKRKLGESYTLEDVDQVYNDLKAYSLNVSKLPFDVNKKVGVKVVESANKVTNPINTKSSIYDDDVDDSLIRLANSGF